jgi:predicted PurR-regulated permease PerM
VLSVVATLVVALLLWRLADLLIILFAAIVLAVALDALAGQLATRLHVPVRWSVPTAVLLITLVLAGTVWLVGDPLVEQMTKLRERVPAATQAVVGWLNSHAIGQQVLELWAQATHEVPWARLMGVAGLTLVALGNVALIVILAIYLAAAPAMYRGGLLRLLPLPYRSRVDGALSASAGGLRRWLLGQSISMAFVGTTTALGLLALGIPLPLAVGLISGLLAFIPFFGAIAGGLLAVLLAFMEGPRAALYVTILCIAIQQVEGNVLMPLVQRWAVELPPVLGILASVVFGVLFGIVGVLFATPLMVVAMIMVRELYVEGFLEQRHE